MGNAILLFPKSNSLQLVRTLLKDQVPLDNLTELEQEALLEVGNVMLNACFGTVTNLLQLNITISPYRKWSRKSRRYRQIR